MREILSTIAAISTPPGKGGVAIIRISGDDALNITNKVFSPMGKGVLCKENARRALRGNIVYGGEVIDDGLAVFFPAPHSYTGEDMVEISCHGGILITASVLEAVLAAGAVPAMAGEFTRRAFIGGKLTLTDAEAIGMLLDARTRGQLQLSSVRARDNLSSALDELCCELTSLLADIYARIDYPDEDLGDFTNDECIEMLSKTREKMARLCESYRAGHAICEGIPTVICGLANAGKSTLYNLLAGDEYAIVTDIPGTTRDVLEREVTLGSILLRLYDTAGFREGNLDTVEQIGIDRSIAKIESAELILFLIDTNVGLISDNIALIEKIKTSNAKKIALISKCDSGECENLKLYESLRASFDALIPISASARPEETLAALSELLEHMFIRGEISISNDAIIANARQNASLTRALEFTDSALCAFRAGLPQDISSSDIELALGQISELSGRAVSEEVVSNIFSRFCVGK